MRNRTLGSIFIVAGTTIGAGMLAMPLVSAGVGFQITAVLLISLWAITCLSALLMVEVYQHHPGQYGLSSLCRQLLGRAGQWLTGFSMLFLLYALTAAYISGAGELLAHSLSILFSVPVADYWGALLFTLLGGGVVCIGTHSVDLINRILFISKLIVLIAMLIVMLPYVRMENLQTLPLQQGLVISALPIIFTSFGFHGSIPSVVSYLGGNVRQLRWVFIAGSGIPLCAYLAWQLTTLGAIHTDSLLGILANEAGLNGLMLAVKNIVMSPYVEITMQLFADLALATSFLGVTLGLFDYLADLFRSSHSALGRTQTGLITFIPPLLFALFYPKGFVLALGYASIALAVLALLIPSLLVWQSRKRFPAAYQVLGGSNLLVWLVFCCGWAMIIVQVCILLGMIPSLG